MRLVDAYGGSGSGTLIDGNGNILTNFHVIEGSSSVQVYLGDRYVGVASVVGFHDLLDLAIVQINAGRSSLIPIPISRSEPMSGDEIITIGYPLGMSGESTVTVGVVSAYRTVDGQRYLQTDAAINPGNSGGAALDRQGNLVGIPTWMYNVENIGFLIPLREMANTIEQLKRGSRTVALPPTPTPRPTPTPTPTPVPRSTLTIDGGYLKPFVDRYSIPNGTLTVSPAPGYDGMFPTPSRVRLFVVPDRPGSQIFWQYVDWSAAGDAYVDLVSHHHDIQIVIVLPTPTPTPPPTNTPTPPPDGEYYYNKGDEHWMANEFEQAIDSLSTAIGLTETEWWGSSAYYRRGDSYLKLGQHQLAILDFEKTIELIPDWHLPYWAWGVAYYQQGDYERAILGFDVAIQLDPLWAAAYDWRGAAQYKLEEYQLAIQNYDVAIQLEPDVAAHYEDRGSVYSWLDQFTEAEADWAKACSLDSQYC